MPAKLALLTNNRHLLSTVAVVAAPVIMNISIDC